MNSGVIRLLHLPCSILCNISQIFAHSYDNRRWIIRVLETGSNEIPCVEIFTENVTRCRALTWNIFRDGRNFANPVKRAGEGAGETREMRNMCKNIGGSRDIARREGRECSKKAVRISLTDIDSAVGKSRRISQDWSLVDTLLLHYLDSFLLRTVASAATYEMWLAPYDVEPEHTSCKAFRGKLSKEVSWYCRAKREGSRPRSNSNDFSITFCRESLPALSRGINASWDSPQNVARLYCNAINCPAIFRIIPPTLRF